MAGSYIIGVTPGLSSSGSEHSSCDALIMLNGGLVAIHQVSIPYQQCDEANSKGQSHRCAQCLRVRQDKGEQPLFFGLVKSRKALLESKQDAISITFLLSISEQSLLSSDLGQVQEIYNYDRTLPPGL